MIIGDLIFVLHVPLMPTCTMVFRRSNICDINKTAVILCCTAQPISMQNFQTSVHPYLPAILMGLVAIIAGLLGLFLPETRGIHLPDTIAEANAV